MAALFTPRELADSQASDPAAKKLIPIIFTSHLEKSSCYQVSEKWAHHSVSKPDSKLSINVWLISAVVDAVGTIASNACSVS